MGKQIKGIRGLDQPCAHNKLVISMPTGHDSKNL